MSLSYLYLVNNLLPIITVEDFKVFREYFPELQHKKVCGIVSTFNPHESQLKYANKKGIIVMGLGEYLMELKNPEGFQIQDY